MDRSKSCWNLGVSKSSKSSSTAELYLEVIKVFEALILHVVGLFLSFDFRLFPPCHRPSLTIFNKPMLDLSLDGMNDPTNKFLDFFEFIFMFFLSSWFKSLIYIHYMTIHFISILTLCPTEFILMKITFYHAQIIVQMPLPSTLQFALVSFLQGQCGS